ncbi:trehalose 6-phosphatase [Stella humosa]|uniref:Trehalose 6-phosphate phosphatase n=1 Tax=Stella humosa TaxID=94 RepID=A0A3N1M7T8_9PROT|nr:trehalose-phosphatase [Stella humosa]ROQ01902.1 trehalose 6-phosphatase [Stella humosa]BBK32291.1 putative trehalose-phosphate phosphatase [Stella humosa]
MNANDGGWLAPPAALDGSWALFLDVDGTLLDIADEPQSVTVPETLRPDLRRLAAGLGGAMALVSGRTVAELDRLFAPLVLPAAGQHGAEIRLDPLGAVHSGRIDPVLPGLAPEVRALAAVWPNVEVEEKGAAIAVHFRRAPEAEVQLTRALRSLVEAAGGAIELLEGKMVRELRDRHHTKGTAVGIFMASPPFTGRRPVFIGDDVTDADGFAAVEAVGGLAMAVGIHPAIARAPSFTDAAAVRTWLSVLARESKQA